jgi:branched-chain amino acid transport system substrate-binding protein
MLTPDAPIPAVQDFAKRFAAKFNVTPDHNAIQGYMAVWIVKAATEKMGKPDAEHLAETLHGMTIKPSDQPGILMETTILPSGDMDRQSFMVQVEDGHAKVVKILPKLGS